MPPSLNIDTEFVWQSKRWRNQAEIQHHLENALQATHRYALKKKLIQHKFISVTLLFSHNRAVQKLNAEWRSKDKPTNVLSFPAKALPPLNFVGDIVFAYETVEKEAQMMQKTFLNHLSHLTVHGFLHLIGLDHENDDDADSMEAIEIRILKNLGIDNPYLSHHD